MLNKVTLIGNLGKDPECKVLPNGNDTARFSLATTETWKDKQSGEKMKRTQWHNIVAWLGNAKFATFLKKGMTVCVEGTIEYRTYEAEGVTKYVTEIKAMKIINLTKREDNGSSGASFSAAANASKAAPKDDQLDDDLPF